MENENPQATVRVRVVVAHKKSSYSDEPLAETTVEEAVAIPNGVTDLGPALTTLSALVDEARTKTERQLMAQEQLAEAKLDAEEVTTS